MSIVSRLQAYWSLLKDSPLNFLLYLIFLAVAILLSLILHEISHGYAAMLCGDPTAKMLGRLSLNPSKHLDPVGTVCMVLFGIGWAKPVPINPRNFSEPRKDDFLVSIAGIAMNLTLFLLSITLSVALTRVVWTSLTLEWYQASELIGFQQSYFFYTSSSREVLDGLIRSPLAAWIQRFLLMMSQINLSLAIFNFFPIPPLDGFHILNDTLLRGKLRLSRKAFQLTQFVVILLCITGALSYVHSFLYDKVFDAFLELLLKITGLA